MTQHSFGDAFTAEFEDLLAFPAEDHVEPELQRKGWQSRQALCRQVLRR